MRGKSAIFCGDRQQWLVYKTGFHFMPTKTRPEILLEPANLRVLFSYPKMRSITKQEAFPIKQVTQKGPARGAYVFAYRNQPMTHVTIVTQL